MIRTLLLTLVVVCLAVLSGISHARITGEISAESRRPAEGKILLQKLKKDTSLDELIISSGYTISDADVASFLTDFLALNQSVKSISSLKKGSLIKIPLKQLRKTSTAPPVISEKRQPGAPARKAVRKKSIRQEQEPVSVVTTDKALMLHIVQDLFSSLGEQVTTEQDGFKLFQLSEKSDLSFDTGLFPIVNLHNEHILIIDYTNRFPEEVKNLIEIAWPEYRVISMQRRTDLRELIPLLLRESGYAFYEKGTMISGGSSQIEYHADYLVYGKSGTMSENDISLISILEKNEYQTPVELVSWFGGRDIRIIELSSHKKQQIERKASDVTSLDIWMSGREFAEKVLGLLEYPYEVNARLSLSKKAEIRYNLQADIVVDFGHRRKIIAFSDLSAQESEYARSLGLDITYIEPFEKKGGILKKVASLLSVNRSDSPRMNAAYLTPKGVRYHLQVPGHVVQGLKRTLFFTDSGHEIDMLRSVIADGISVVQF